MHCIGFFFPLLIAGAMALPAPQPMPGGRSGQGGRGGNGGRGPGGPPPPAIRGACPVPPNGGGSLAALPGIRARRTTAD
uniref:Uncharacterized protein n=1 Tax=Pyricularia oryzae (strain 70-15 / ATCC MYA-4617 / FGSC 8958) TaxID=242507 RepID=Q2KEP4_PYRO7|nr:hypothetical protein MGCH7_ch7g992 [Pyricularia oryzae 70-15]